MKLMLIQWGGGLPELFNVAKELIRSGHDICYWTEARAHFGSLRAFAPRAILHDWRDAMNGIPPEGIVTVDFPPPGAALIEKLCVEESLIMTMMNKHYGHFSVSERKHFYYGLLQYWSGVFASVRPDAVIFPMVPHTAPDLVIFSLAKLLRVKTLMCHSTHVSDRMLLMEDFRIGSTVLKDAALRNKDTHLKLSELSPDLERHYTDMVTNTYITPLSITLFRKHFSGLNLFLKKAQAFLQSIRERTFLRVLAGFMLRQFNCVDNLKREYASVQTCADFSQKFLYFPLHYQPEATTSPLGGVFADQQLVAEIVSASLPPGWFLYVKEHPAQWTKQTTKFSSHRGRGYYRRLATLANVRIVPVETETYHLEHAARGVVTVTGTAGWEAAMKLKPSLVFGYPWYKECPLVFQVSDVLSCKKAIASIAAGYAPSKEDILGFLAALDKTSFHGYLDPHTKQLSNLSPEEATKNISEVFLKALQG